MGESHSKYLADEREGLNCDICAKPLQQRHPHSKAFQTYICIVNRRNLKYSHTDCLNLLNDCTKCNKRLMVIDLIDQQKNHCLSCDTQ